jgi:hypothetical protein
MVYISGYIAAVCFISTVYIPSYYDAVCNCSIAFSCGCFVAVLYRLQFIFLATSLPFCFISTVSDISRYFDTVWPPFVVSVIAFGLFLAASLAFLYPQFLFSSYFVAVCLSQKGDKWGLTNTKLYTFLRQNMETRLVIIDVWMHA